MSGTGEPRPSGKEQDAKRQLLLRLGGSLIRELKKAALDRDTTASAIAAEAIRDWLKSNARSDQDRKLNATMGKGSDEK